MVVSCGLLLSAVCDLFEWLIVLVSVVLLPFMWLRICSVLVLWFVYFVGFCCLVTVIFLYMAYLMFCLWVWVVVCGLTLCCWFGLVGLFVVVGGFGFGWNVVV